MKKFSYIISLCFIVIAVAIFSGCGSNKNNDKEKLAFLDSYTSIDYNLSYEQVCEKIGFTGSWKGGFTGEDTDAIAYEWIKVINNATIRIFVVFNNNQVKHKTIDDGQLNWEGYFAINYFGYAL